MNDSISYKLDEIERNEGVRIFFACESGSRAWGFPSADSDYDVRFIYVRPIDWYLSIDEGRDVIETHVSDSLDINGWDLKKALGLFRKSNPPLMEWLGSPIVYREKFIVTQQMRDLVPIFYSRVSSSYHYLQMARRNFREYLRGEQVWVKKYFYVLRPVLAAQWIERDLGVVPTDFNVMVEKLVVDPTLRHAIDDLLLKKRQSAELDSGPRIEPISAFIESELERWETQAAPSETGHGKTEVLNVLFRSALKEIWGA